jgi:hypothetical protein
MKHMLWLKRDDDTIEKYVEIISDFNSQRQAVSATYRWILKRLSQKNGICLKVGGNEKQ